MFDNNDTWLMQYLFHTLALLPLPQQDDAGEEAVCVLLHTLPEDLQAMPAAVLQCFLHLLRHDGNFPGSLLRWDCAHIGIFIAGHLI